MKMGQYKNSNENPQQWRTGLFRKEMVGDMLERRE
jgi:hypothetical protein